MAKKQDAKPPLGVPNSQHGMPTLPSDAGDDVQERFRYQSAIGVVLLAEALQNKGNPLIALWCEHHDDFLVELKNGKHHLVQVKTVGSEGDVWKIKDPELQKTLKRFCEIEDQHGDKVEQYAFCSNAKPYIPSQSAAKPENLAQSPERLVFAAKGVSKAEEIPEPYKAAFFQLEQYAEKNAECLLRVLKKLTFRQGPSLRGYDDALVASVVPALPGCASMPSVRIRQLKDAMIAIVQNACRKNNDGLDGVVAYLTSDGRPENAVRHKCIPVETFKQFISERQSGEFKFVECGLSVKIGSAKDRSTVLQQKMRNSFLSGQFEGMKWRMLSADSKLMEKSLENPEAFEDYANQLSGAVLLACKDVEAKHSHIADPRTRGISIYRDIISGMESLASDHPQYVNRESKDTLIGVAGMLSGECKFGWGVDLEEDTHGA